MFLLSVQAVVVVVGCRSAQGGTRQTPHSLPTYLYPTYPRRYLPHQRPNRPSQHIHTMFLRNATHLLRRSITPSTRASPSLLSSHLVRSYTRGFASAAASAVQEDTIHNSPWSTFPMAPPDPIIGLTEAYLKDNDPNKVRW